MSSEGCNNTVTTAGMANSNSGSLPGSLGRDYRNKQSTANVSEINSDEELDDSKSTLTHTLERHKSDRNISVNKPEEDRRRRTIIIEKKNSSYGFTLQTYGIHYRREQEIEMITYVDYVEYDGPAYRAGMREGDVILSINGIDMEKADHKTLVELIKKCDTRMRMVVLFEDCVRKVALHMRYIQLQNKLQDKINELERACLQERQLLAGKWKTHSLPARKKAGSTPIGEHNGFTNNNNTMNGNSNDGQSTLIYRPAISTEDVVNFGHSRYQMHQQQQQQQQQQHQPIIIPPPDQYIVAYQYLDPNYRYVLKPSTSNSSGEYFISVGPQRSPSECHYILTRDGSTEMIQHRPPSLSQQNSLSNHPSQMESQSHQQSCCAEYEEQQQQQQQKLSNSIHQNTDSRASRQKTHCHGHSCNPCLGNFGKKTNDKKNGEDDTSLDAYDLASSPCCASHCVPTRRRSRNSKEHHHHHHKHKHRDKDGKDRQRPRSQSHASPENHQQSQQQLQQQQQHQQPHHHHHHHHHHHNTNVSGQQSQSLQRHQLQQQNTSSLTSAARSKYFNLSTNLASHCSLHSCTSSEFAPADSTTSYTTSLSTDTLYWDPQSEGNSRQPSTKSRQSYHQSSNSTITISGSTKNQQLTQKSYNQQATAIYQQHPQRFCTQIQSVHPQIYQTPVCVNKPKSWDNLTTKAFGGYGFGFGYLDAGGGGGGGNSKPPMKLPPDSGNNIVAVGNNRHSMPRKNSYGRYSTYTDHVENYAPPPSQFVEEISTLTVFVKKTEQMVTEKSLPTLQPPSTATATTTSTATAASTTIPASAATGSTTNSMILKNNNNNNNNNKN